jgi:hypothetical protein
MTVFIKMASDWSYEEIREFDSLENAFATLRKEFKENRFVVDFKSRKAADVDIMIYDTWIE